MYFFYANIEISFLLNMHVWICTCMWKLKYYCGAILRNLVHRIFHWPGVHQLSSGAWPASPKIYLVSLPLAGFMSTYNHAWHFYLGFCDRPPTVQASKAITLLTKLSPNKHDLQKHFYLKLFYLKSAYKKIQCIPLCLQIKYSKAHTRITFIICKNIIPIHRHTTEGQTPTAHASLECNKK